MSWMWNDPLYSHYAYHFLNSNYNMGETSWQTRNSFSNSGIPSTNLMYEQSHVNSFNSVDVNNSQMPNPPINFIDIEKFKGNGNHLFMKNENTCNLKIESKVETQDDMQEGNNSKFSFNKQNNIYGHEVKSEFDPEVTTIMKEKISEIYHDNESKYDMHIVKDKINVHQKELNIHKYKVKLEEFETEELVVNENYSNTNEPLSFIEKNSDMYEINKVFRKKEYSSSNGNKIRNNNYLNLLNKADGFHLQVYNDLAEPITLTDTSMNRPNKSPIICLMEDDISSGTYTDTICKDVQSEHDITNKSQSTFLQIEDITNDTGLTNEKTCIDSTNFEQDIIQNHTDSEMETLFIVNSNNHNWNCTLCGEKFYKRHDLKQHMFVHAESDVFICSVCDYKTLRSNRLKVHMRMHTGERPFKCSECEFTCTQQGNLKNHIKRYHRQELKCPDCKMLFKGKINFNNHKKLAHSATKRYACNVCDYRTNDSSALRCHAVTHSGIKNYICSICNQGFRDNYGLKIHMLVHSGGKLLTCSECKYSTIEQLNLEKHMHRVHSTQNSASSIPVEEKKVCADCGYACKSMVLFDKHMQIHALHGKLLKCPNCTYKCKKYSTLREHSLLHKEKVLRCKSCNFRFVNKDCYEAHMLTHDEN